MGRLVIYGTGGFGREVASLVRRTGRDFVFADRAERDPIWGIPVIAPANLRHDDEVCIAIGDSIARKNVAAQLGLSATNVVASTAIIGDDVAIGEGAVLCDHSVITASARIGRHFQCNIYSYVAHDCVVGDFVTFGPRVSCNGNVHIGDGAHLASDVTVRNGTPERPLLIGAGAFICMGAVITRDVPTGARVGPGEIGPMRQLQAA